MFDREERCGARGGIEWRRCEVGCCGALGLLAVPDHIPASRRPALVTLGHPSISRVGRPPGLGTGPARPSVPQQAEQCAPDLLVFFGFVRWALGTDARLARLPELEFALGDEMAALALQRLHRVGRRIERDQERRRHCEASTRR